MEREPPGGHVLGGARLLPVEISMTDQSASALGHASALRPAHARQHIARVLLIWFAAAVGIGSLGVLPRAPALAPASVLGLTLLALVLYKASARVRASAEAFDLRWLVLPHTVRAPIGAIFLWEYMQGRLPGVFALRAGYGDIAAGVLALLAVRAARLRSRREIRLLLVWNALAALDILIVLATAAFLLVVRGDPLMTQALGRMPFPLLPLFVVPLVIIAHLLVFARARGANLGGAAV